MPYQIELCRCIPKGPSLPCSLVAFFVRGNLLCTNETMFLEHTDPRTEFGNASRWKEGLVTRAAEAQKKVDLMQLVYGGRESLAGSSLLHEDSDESDEDDLFRLRKNSHKVGIALQLSFASISFQGCAPRRKTWISHSPLYILS